MNKNIVQHFLTHHLDLMLAKSLRDCHARGVDSILFDDTPQARIRLFIANPNSASTLSEAGSRPLFVKGRHSRRTGTSFEN